jgi:hypothetical protein
VSEGYVLSSEQDRRYSRINTIVKVENNVAAMLDTATLAVAMRSVQVTRKPTRRGQRIERNILDKSPDILLEKSLPNGKAFYLALPRRETFKNTWGQEGERTTEVSVRAQWQADYDSGEVCRILSFPAPELHDATTYDVAKHGQPDFSETDQLFWADEQTDKLEEAT